MSMDRAEHGRAESRTARSAPPGFGVRRVRVVLERHFKCQRQAAKRVPDVFGSELQHVVLVLAGLVAVFGLKVRAGDDELRAESLLLVRLARGEARQHLA